MAFALLSLTPADSALAKPEITEFPLAAGDFYPRAITAGLDGNLWFTNTKGQIGQSVGAQHFETDIARMTPAGQVTEFTPPSQEVSAITAGPLGSLWYAGPTQAGRLTIAGQFTAFPLQAQSFSPAEIVAGADGNLWFPKRNDSGSDAIVRMTPAGQLTEFALPNRESGPNAITLGPDGNIWFTEYFGDRIGRITPSGEITEFPVSSHPLGITSGPDGNLWFPEGSGVGRITPSGQVTAFAAPDDTALGPIVTGPDGRLWFSSGPAVIGRLTPSGRTSEIKLPSSERDLADLTPGPEDAVWYTAAGDGPCEGGGGTCQAYIPRHPGIVGRVTPGPLSVAIRRINSASGRAWTWVRLTCQGGRADSVCRGAIHLSKHFKAVRGRIDIGNARFRLPADARRQVAVPLSRLGRAMFARRNLRVVATVDLSNGDDTSRPLRLHRQR